ARMVIYLCIAQFSLWYGSHLFETAEIARTVRQYDLWDSINHQNPERRIDVNRRIAKIPGKLLVLVRYWPQHIFQEEWVYNEAEISGARVIWARDLGPEENEKLLGYYPDRTAWLLQPDFRPPRLTPYRP